MKLTRGQKLVLEALQEYGPLDPHQIAERTGYAYRTLYNAKDDYLPGLLALKLIHVKSWAPQRGHGGAPVPTYAAGPGRNAPKPAPLKTTDKSRKYRETTGRYKKVANAPSVVAVMLGLNDGRKTRAAKSELATLLGL